MSNERTVRVGVDVGGTFTDLVAVDDGRLQVTKVPSTPDAPDEGVAHALDAGADQGDWPLAAVSFFGHGTTVATNAVLEGEWADTALVTTDGFRDALEIGRQDRPDIYDPTAERPDPVVPRDRRFTVGGRLDERGREVAALDDTDVEDAVTAVAEADVDSVAVCTLFSFEDDAHERRVADAVRAATDLPVSESARVHGEIREYERTLVTCLNAALAPVMDAYLDSLSRRLDDAGVPARLRVMGSNGGLMTGGVARDRPVRTLLSGPAAGVRGAVHAADQAGVGGDVLTMDMGGTSCDVSVVRDGDPVVTTDVTVADYPVGVPMLDVHTVGSGGGSVAWLDAGDALRVGPRSAGADPGPVCYGRGGTRPTTTDAHCVLGRIDPRGFVAEADDDSVAAARDAIRETVADPLGVSVDEAAHGVLDVANANMERALRVVSVERGHDPREFTVVAFGGAGPLHAAALADALDVPQVLVPQAAGVLSALGVLVSDVRYDYATSRVRPWADLGPADLDATFADLEAQGRERLADEGVPEDRWRLERAADVRYRGQTYDLRVPVPDDLDADAMATVADRFHDAHERRYGHASPDEPLELVTVRVRARGVVDPPEREPVARASSLADARTETRSVSFDGERRDTPVYDGDRLPADEALAGPAILAGGESTVVVPPAATARALETGDVLVDLGGDAA
jgi:N-methylhydantoinase A